MELTIYRVSQDVHSGHDTFDAMIVIAETEQEAIELSIAYAKPKEWKKCWAFLPEDVKAEKLGYTCNGRGDFSHVVLASYNAG